MSHSETMVFSSKGDGVELLGCSRALDVAVALVGISNCAVAFVVMSSENVEVRWNKCYL